VGTPGPLGVCKRCSSVSQEILERVTGGQWPIYAAPLVFQDWWNAALADGWQARELQRETQTKNALWYLMDAGMPTPYGSANDRSYAALCELRGELERRDRALETVWVYLEAWGLSHER
jgi:hypothetical protein